MRSSGTEVVELEESVAGSGMCGLCVRGNPILRCISKQLCIINNAIHIIVISQFILLY